MNFDFTYQAKLRLEFDLQSLQRSPELADFAVGLRDVVLFDGHLLVEFIELRKNDERQNSVPQFTLNPCAYFTLDLLCACTKPPSLCGFSR